MNLKTARTAEDIAKCYPVMHALRPHLAQESFVEKVQAIQKSDGYQLVFIEFEDKATAAVGFRYMNTLYAGKTIYIDDLTTLPEYRGNGFAGALLDFVHLKAKSEGLDAVALDSGHLRFDAHRLYLNKGYKITCHHFEYKIS
jgi:GNAT superfamily N-acetyltransferase